MNTNLSRCFLPALMVLLLLGSCEMKSLDPKGSVKYWANTPDLELVAIADGFTGLDLTTSPIDQNWTTLLTATENAPDLIFTDLSYDGQVAAQGGLLADLTAYRGRMGSSAHQWRGLAELIDSERRSYFLPSTVYLWRLFYNQGVLDRAGAKAPSTLAELEKAFADLRNQNIIPLALGSTSGWSALAWLSALDLQHNGVAAHRELISGKRLFSDSSLTVVYETLARWRDKGWVDPDSGAQDWPESLAKVSEGSAGFVFLGSSVVNRFRAAREIHNMAVPGKQGPGDKAQLAGIQGFYLSAKALFPEAALALADAYLSQGVKGQVLDSYHLPAVQTTFDPETEGLRGPQSKELGAGAAVVAPLDKVLEPRAAHDAGQALILFFAKDSTMSVNELSSALAAAVKPRS